MKVPLKPEPAPRQRYKKVRGLDLVSGCLSQPLGTGWVRSWTGEKRESIVKQRSCLKEDRLGRGRKRRGRSLVELLWVTKQSCESYIARTFRAGQNEIQISTSVFLARLLGPLALVDRLRFCFVPIDLVLGFVLSFVLSLALGLAIGRAVSKWEEAAVGCKCCELILVRACIRRPVFSSPIHALCCFSFY